MRRLALIALCVAVLAGCGGGETVSPTGPIVGTLPKAEQGDPAAGKKVFLSSGCGGCHTFAPAGTKGTTGPNLSTALKGKDAEFIRQSIVDPNAKIAKGYPPNVMPQTYGQQLSSKQIADLVAFLSQAK